MQIRTINNKDYENVDKLIREVFTNTSRGYGNEAELVDKIRRSESYINDLEIVAVENVEIIGHGLLSEVRVINSDNSYVGLVLAPLEVAINHQNKGTGKILMKELERRARNLNYQFISILGHSDYYPKFGYIPASKFNIKAPFDVPDEVFMIRPLFEGALDTVDGIVKYSNAFE
ncbi:N-acetyltransferase [Dellaglioa algida]|nr:N-acetyltransferase [Dellaglioa algida]